MQTELKSTPMGCSYPNKTGAYSTEMTELWNKHVPSEGMAKTLHGELLRAIGRLFYEYNNNGNYNAYKEETKYDHEFEEEVVVGGEITPMYKTFLSLIESYILNTWDEILEVQNIIINSPDHGREYYSDKNVAHYNALCDKVMYFILTTEDQQLPDTYNN